MRLIEFINENAEVNSWDSILSFPEFDIRVLKNHIFLTNIKKGKLIVFSFNFNDIANCYLVHCLNIDCNG